MSGGKLPRRALLKGAAITAAGLATGGTYRLARGAEATEPNILGHDPNTDGLSQEVMTSETREMLTDMIKDVKYLTSILERRILEHPTDWWAS